MRESGARNVPSFYRLRKIQKALRSESSVPTIQCKSEKQNIFYINDPRDIIAKVRLFFLVVIAFVFAPAQAKFIVTGLDQSSHTPPYSRLSRDIR